MDVSNLLLPAKKISKAHNATRYVKQGKKRQKNSKHTHYIISPRVVIKISIITSVRDMNTQYKAEPRPGLGYCEQIGIQPLHKRMNEDCFNYCSHKRGTIQQFGSEL